MEESTRRRNKRQVISQGLGALPSSSVSSVSRRVRCLPPSILRARTRSSLEVSRRTRPISRRYMRTGSSSTSVVSASGSQSVSSLSVSAEASSAPSAVFFAVPGSSHWSSAGSVATGEELTPPPLDSPMESSSWLALTPRKISTSLSLSSGSSLVSRNSSGLRGFPLLLLRGAINSP